MTFPTNPRKRGKSHHHHHRHHALDPRFISQANHHHHRHHALDQRFISQAICPCFQKHRNTFNVLYCQPDAWPTTPTLQRTVQAALCVNTAKQTRHSRGQHLWTQTWLRQRAHWKIYTTIPYRHFKRAYTLRSISAKHWLTNRKRPYKHKGHKK